MKPKLCPKGREESSVFLADTVPLCSPGEAAVRHRQAHKAPASSGHPRKSRQSMEQQEFQKEVCTFSVTCDKSAQPHVI